MMYDKIVVAQRIQEEMAASCKLPEHDYDGTYGCSTRIYLFYSTFAWNNLDQNYQLFKTICNIKIQIQKFQIAFFFLLFHVLDLHDIQEACFMLLQTKTFLLNHGFITDSGWTAFWY